jgi:hypothetical protein
MHHNGNDRYSQENQFQKQIKLSHPQVLFIIVKNFVDTLLPHQIQSVRSQDGDYLKRFLPSLSHRDHIPNRNDWKVGIRTDRQVNTDLNNGIELELRFCFRKPRVLTFQIPSDVIPESSAGICPRNRNDSRWNSSLVQKCLKIGGS